MPVRSSKSKAVRKPRARKIELSSAVLEDLVEAKAEQIVHRHTIFDLKMVAALVVIGIASLVMNTFAAGNYNLSAATSTPSSTPSTVTTTARLLVQAKTDSETVSRILVPTPVSVSASTASSTMSEVLGKWDLVAEKEPVKLLKVRFSAINPDYTVRTTATEFTKLRLSTGNGVQLGTVDKMTDGYVEFVLDNFTVPLNQMQTLVLRGVVTGSGVMKENSIIRFGVNLQVANTWQAVSAITGEELKFTDFSFRAPAYAIGALTAPNLYHNSVPLIYSSWGSWSVYSKPINVESKIFPVAITAVGEKGLRISKLLMNVKVNGMISTGTSSTGYVTGFKLYAADSQNNVPVGASPIATNTNCLVSPMAGASTGGTVTIPGVGTCGIETVYLTFDQKNDVAGAMDNLVVPAGQTKYFMLVADTTHALSGKTSGQVSLIAQIAGNKGPLASSDPKVMFWSGGGVFYHYTPTGKSENTSAYNHANTYPVTGYPVNFGF